MTDKIIIQNKPPKSPAAAGILSGFFPGAGQLYNGEGAKALLFFLIFAGCMTMMPRGPHPFLPLVFAAFYIYQIIDAVQTAKAVNLKSAEAAAAAAGAPGSAPAGAPVLGSAAGPGFAAPGSAAASPIAGKPIAQGSVFWGLLLMAIGAIFLLANFDVVELDQILEFWPVAVILVGLKIIFESLRKRD
jgi:TM2 domain-containing membrane protein YozV